MIDQIDAINFELRRLYQIRATACTNMLYYGRRAATLASRILWLQVGAAVGSVGTVSGFLAAGTAPTWKWIPIFLGISSAVCAALPAILEYAERINKFETLHFAYRVLFDLVPETARNIRRSGLITDKEIGVVLLLDNLCTKFRRMDHAKRQQELRDKCEELVRKRFPADSFWYAAAPVGLTQQEATPAQTGLQESSVTVAEKASADWEQRRSMQTGGAFEEVKDSRL